MPDGGIAQYLFERALAIRHAVYGRDVYMRVPITNYGIAIACMKGILRRSIAIFPHLLEELEG